MAFEVGKIYGNGSNSTVGPNAVTTALAEKALRDAKKEMYFSQFADVETMPRNHGKTITQYRYLPIIDERNTSDQGLDANGSKYANGNLYGSSKDIGALPGKLPLLREEGGRVNRVGVTRKQVKGTLVNYGHFLEYSKDSIQFDNDVQLLDALQTELLNAACKVSEDVLQVDLLNAAGTVRYPNDATSRGTIEEADVLTYEDIMRLSVDLDNARTPKQLRIITGTNFTDTKTIGATRILFVGSELIPTLEAMKDLHGQPAFTRIEKYAAGTQIMNGEAGAVGQFRVIVVEDMLKWAGVGQNSSTGDFYATNGKLDVFPVLSVGAQSFSVIGWQNNGKEAKYELAHVKPEDNRDRNDPYGKTGFMSIQWFYGFLAQYPERIGLIPVAAKI